MIDISFNEECENFINQTLTQDCLEKFLSILFVGKRSVSVYVTDDKEVQKLNLEFRGKDQTTDILSWSYYENETDEPNTVMFSEGDDADTVGDLVLSAERIQVQAKENGWDFDTELIRLLAHGCAHLAGWDHERSEEEAQKMLEIEIDLLKKVGLVKLYPSNS